MQEELQLEKSCLSKCFSNESMDSFSSFKSTDYSMILTWNIMVLTGMKKKDKARY